MTFYRHFRRVLFMLFFLLGWLRYISSSASTTKSFCVDWLSYVENISISFSLFQIVRHCSNRLSICTHRHRTQPFEYNLITSFTCFHSVSNLQFPRLVVKHRKIDVGILLCMQFYWTTERERCECTFSTHLLCSECWIVCISSYFLFCQNIGSSHSLGLIMTEQFIQL